MNPQQAYTLAIQHHQARHLVEAEALYRQVLAAEPGYAEAWCQLGVLAHAVGRMDVALRLMRHAIAIQPADAASHYHLGKVYRTLGQIEQAVACFQQAVQLRPDFPEAENSLGMALASQGRFAAAVAVYRRALQLRPDHDVTCNNLGVALAAHGQISDAIAAFRHALQLKPDNPEACNNLGLLLVEVGQFDEAVTLCNRALELKADYPEARNNLGSALLGQGLVDEAAAAYRRAIELNPGDADAWSNLGGACKDQGLLDEAIASFRRAVQLQPGRADFQSNLIYTLYFHPRQGDGVLSAEHESWNRRFAEPVRKFHRPHANDLDPHRRLRVGYVSPDFRRHPISVFLMPLLEAHNHADVEVFCYASVKSPDELTGRMMKSADVWRETLGLGHEALAQLIRADQIDILVDLTQHMANNRMPMFAHKPAPIQVAWLGYPAGTGLPAMDYRFTDQLLDPEDSAWSASLETPVRLPDSWFCYNPLDSLGVAGLPALRAGHITFGSLNNFCKTNEALFRLWVSVLQAVENSHLLLHCPAGAAQSRVREWFEKQGVAAHRLELVPRTASFAKFLELHSRIDIALDPFPYNGGTTTCDALWMGVPVVSLAGPAAVSRLGLSTLTAAGFSEWVANSEDEYVSIAARLAGDLSRLAELRATMRARMQASPLMDAPRFARNVEAAYRRMWGRWCEKGGGV